MSRGWMPSIMNSGKDAGVIAGRNCAYSPVETPLIGWLTVLNAGSNDGCNRCAIMWFKAPDEVDSTLFPNFHCDHCRMSRGVFLLVANNGNRICGQFIAGFRARILRNEIQ